MEFRLWFENKEAMTSSIIDAIFQSVKLTVAGHWSLKKNISQADTVTTQLNRLGYMTGRGVINQDDFFTVYVWVNAYKKRKEDRVFPSGSAQATKYDIVATVNGKKRTLRKNLDPKNAEQVRFSLSSEFPNVQLVKVSGLPNWVKDPNQWEKLDTYDVKTGHDLIGINVSITTGSGVYLEPIGNTQDDNVVVRTPYDAAQYIKSRIESHGKDDDDDNGDEPDLTPTPSFGNKLVGV